MGTRIRSATPGDVPALDAIYTHWVRTSAVTFDVEAPSRAERLTWYRRRFLDGDHDILALDVDGQPRGFAWTGPIRSRTAYCRSVEVSVYLAPEVVGRGHGGTLLDRLLASGRGRGRHRAYGAVSLPNPASRAMLRRHGFRSAGVWREVGFKLGRYWDVEWFEREL